MKRSMPRGNALIVSVISVSILMVLVVGSIRYTGVNREAAAAKQRGDRISACAETARRFLLSSLRTFGVTIANLQINRKLPDDPDPSKTSQMLTGHYGTGDTAQATVVAVSAQSVSASKDQVRDVSNVIAGTTLGGQFYKVTVKCREPGADRESELEFVFRHGI